MKKIALILFVCFISVFATYEAEAQSLSVQVGSGVNNASAGFVLAYLGWRQPQGFCNGKFWICEWFPEWKAEDPSDLSQSIGVQIIHDGTNPLPFELHLTHPPSAYGGEDHSVFKISSDITFNAEPGSPFSTVLIEAGNYPYNSSLGSYGGYEIPVIGL